MLNKVLIIGRLTKDPEVRFFSSGTQKTTFTIAYNRNYKVNEEWKEEANYFDVETYGQLAERLGRTLSKGYQVLIEGRLSQQRWKNEAGERRSKVVIVADKVAIISKPSSSLESKTDMKEDLAIPNVNETEDFSSDDDIPF